MTESNFKGPGARGRATHLTQSPGLWWGSIWLNVRSHCWRSYMQAWPLPQLCAGQISLPRLPSERLVSPRHQASPPNPLHEALIKADGASNRKHFTRGTQKCQRRKTLIKVNSAAKSWSRCCFTLLVCCLAVFSRPPSHPPFLYDAALQLEALQWKRRDTEFDLNCLVTVTGLAKASSSSTQRKLLSDKRHKFNVQRAAVYIV